MYGVFTSFLSQLHAFECVAQSLFCVLRRWLTSELRVASCQSRASLEFAMSYILAGDDTGLIKRQSPADGQPTANSPAERTKPAEDALPTTSEAARTRDDSDSPVPART